MSDRFGLWILTSFYQQSLLMGVLSLVFSSHRMDPYCYLARAMPLLMYGVEICCLFKAHRSQVWCTRNLGRLYHVWSTYDVGDVFCVAYSAAQQTVYLGAQNTSIQWHELSFSAHRAPLSLESHPLNRRNKFFDSIGPGAIATPRRDVVADILAPGGELVEISKEHIMQYAHYGYVYCMLLAKGGTYNDTGEETLVTGGGDGTIKLWQIADIGDEGIRHLATLENGDNSILSMAVHGTFLYSGRLEGDVDVWDLETRQLIRTVKVNNADILTVAVGQDLIFTGGSDGFGKVITDTNTGSDIR